jgi:hypothetical protein
MGNRAGEGDIIRNRDALALKQGDHARAFDLLAEVILAFWGMMTGSTRFWLSTYWSPRLEQHRSNRAARLLSASESGRKAVGVARTPADQLDDDAYLADVRGRLDGATFAAAWPKGGAMVFEQAVAYALGG